MEAKHTPGPWTLDFDLGHVDGANKEIVCYLARGPSPESKANGLLIAAAPEMLSELEECQKELLGSSSYLETCDPIIIVENFDSFISSLKRRLASVEAAIRKGKGGADMLTCPFCGENDFDLIGLKSHLLNNCEAFAQWVKPESEAKLDELVGLAKPDWSRNSSKGEIMTGPIIQLHPHDCDCPECGSLRAEAKREIFLSIERQRMQRARWPESLTRAMSKLAKLFPTMRGVPGTDPWNVEALIAWMNTGAPTTGSWHAAMFLLGVWNPHTKWNQEGVKMRKGASGKFDLFAAMHGWDQQHIEAALEWINNPFFP